MEQVITQMGVSLASVTDELNSLNSLNNQSKNTSDNPKTFDDLMLKNVPFPIRYFC